MFGSCDSWKPAMKTARCVRWSDWGFARGRRVNVIVVRRPDAGRWDLTRLAKISCAEDVALAEQGLGEWSLPAARANWPEPGGV